MLVASLLIGGLLPAAAHAQDDFNRYFNAAVQLYNSNESERALDQLQRAKQRTQGPQQDVAVAVYEGLILLDLGRREDALAAFKEGLLLDPEAKLPDKVSPKVRDDFEAVRKQVQKIAQKPEQKPPDQKKPPAPPPSEMAQKPDKPLPVKPNLVPPATHVQEPFEPRPSIGEKSRSRMPVVPLALGGVGVVAAGVGAVFGLQSRSGVKDARSAQFQDETRTQLEDARRSARVANVLFGTAGLAAAGALVTWLVLPGEGRAADAKGER